MITTDIALEQLNMTPAALYNWLKRNPQYRPRHKIGLNYLWTDDDVEKIRQARVETKKRHFQGGCCE